MKIEELENLNQNSKLKEKLEQLLNASNWETQYKMCQVILEYINVYFLTQKRKIALEDYNIIRIIKEYQKIDKDLFDMMISINALYNIADEEGATEDNIEELLYKIDYIYGIIKEKYGDIN